MRTWEIPINRDPYHKTYKITGETLKQAVEENLEKMAYKAKTDDYNILEILDYKICWSDGIFGGTGGVKVKISARVSNTQAKGSPKYEEYHNIIEVWVYANKEDVYAETDKSIRQLREMSKMTRKDFAEYFNIPQRTLENWESERNTPPDYLVELIEYKLINEGIINSKSDN